MKKTVFLSILILGLLSCGSDDRTMGTSGLVGQWKLTEAFISAGGPQYWVDIENGEEFTFFENGTFSSNKFSECTTGIFSTDQNGLSLQYDCDGFDPKSENIDGFITFDLELETNYFIVTPTSGPICIEGCSYKYTRR